MKKMATLPVSIKRTLTSFGRNEVSIPHPDAVVTPFDRNHPIGYGRLIPGLAPFHIPLSSVNLLTCLKAPPSRTHRAASPAKFSTCEAQRNKNKRRNNSGCAISGGGFRIKFLIYELVRSKPQKRFYSFTAAPLFLPSLPATISIFLLPFPLSPLLPPPFFYRRWCFGSTQP